MLAIDYTHPSAVNANGVFYAENKLPFVMGTTGGDREQLMSDMESRDAFAVIAPNMGKQIVAMQAGLEELAESSHRHLLGTSWKLPRVIRRPRRIHLALPRLLLAH